MKKIIGLILIVTVVFTSLLSGCGCHNNQKSKKIEVKGVYKLKPKDVSYDKQNNIHYANNIVLLYLKEGISDERKLEIAKKLNGKIAGEDKLVDQIQLRVKTKNLAELKKICESAKEIKEVEDATYDIVSQFEENNSLDDYIYRPKDPWTKGDNWKTSDLSGKNWWLKIIHAPQMWKTIRNPDNFHNGQTLKNIKVGILDGGFNKYHEDLDLTTLIPKAGVAFPRDHGTHVAGIIGAKADNTKGITGVAPNAQLLCYSLEAITLKDFAKEFEEGIANKEDEKYWRCESFSKMMYGLSLCLQYGAKIINVSQGKSQYVLDDDSDHLSKELIDYYGKGTSRHIVKLLEKGYDFAVVQSAGNGASNRIGVDTINNGYFCSINKDNCYNKSRKYKYNDVIDRVIRVASTKEPDVNGRITLARSSNGGDNVDVAAPGENIYSTVCNSPVLAAKGMLANRQYNTMSGTSMAAPVVAGVLAVKLGCDSRIKCNELKQCFKNLPFKAYDNKESPHTTGDYPFIDAWSIICETLGTDEANILKQNNSITYKTYTNARFGYSFKYPKQFKAERYSDNGDGVSMKNGSDQLSMYGSYDIFGDDTGAKIKKRMKSYGYKMSNMVVGKRAFYFEEPKGKKTILHYDASSKKYNVNAGFTITCPKSKLSYYRGIANVMIKSLVFNKSSLNQERGSNDVHGLYQSFLKNNKFERYAYIDIDQDGQDELIAGSQPMICGIFGINNGAVITLAGTDDVNEAPLYLGEWLMDDAVLYSPKEKRLLTYTMGTSGIYYSYKKVKNKMTYKITGGKYGKFTINGKKTSRKTLSKYLDSLDVVKIKDVK